MVDHARRTRQVGLVLAALAVAWFVASVPPALHSALVRLAFVVLWLSVPWVLTRSLRHLAARAGAEPSVVAAVTGASWVLTVGALTAATAAMVGADPAALFGAAGACAAALVLLLLGRALGARTAQQERDPDAWLQGPFLD